MWLEEDRREILEILGLDCGIEHDEFWDATKTLFVTTKLPG